MIIVSVDVFLLAASRVGEACCAEVGHGQPHAFHYREAGVLPSEDRLVGDLLVVDLSTNQVQLAVQLDEIGSRELDVSETAQGPSVKALPTTCRSRREDLPSRY